MTLFIVAVALSLIGAGVFGWAIILVGILDDKGGRK